MYSSVCLCGVFCKFLVAGCCCFCVCIDPSQFYKMYFQQLKFEERVQPSKALVVNSLMLTRKC